MPSRFSYQLYSSRNHPPVEQTLAMLAKTGYREVEGYRGLYDDPERLRKAVTDNGLTMPSGHFSLDLLEKNKKRTLAIAATLGLRHIVIPYLMPEERPKGAKGWKDFGKRLNGLAGQYRQEGYAVAWHNHDFEFQPLRDGTTPHELIFANAPLLDWEIDVAWIVRGKSNPLSWIKRYAGIITLAHVKDIAPRGECADEDGWADLGRGTMKWQAYMDALKSTRCMHWIVEHDKPSDDRRFAQRSLAAAKKY
jgi:sugar phosphate isomerase/epimerase